MSDAYQESLDRIEGAIADLAKKVDALNDPNRGPLPGPVPPGFVAVKPTGPRGAFKVRYWPETVEGEGPYAYAQRANKVIDPATGAPLYPYGRWASIPPAMSAWGLTLPETLDRLTHELEWETQSELDMRAAQEENDRRTDETFNRR